MLYAYFSPGMLTLLKSLYCQCMPSRAQLARGYTKLLLTFFTKNSCRFPGATALRSRFERRCSVTGVNFGVPCSHDVPGYLVKRLLYLKWMPCRAFSSCHSCIVTKWNTHIKSVIKFTWRYINIHKKVLHNKKFIYHLIFITRKLHIGKCT